LRVYLELIEQLNMEFSGEADFIRVDVTGWSDGDVEEALSLLKEISNSYEHYVLQKHFCRHDEGEACTVEVIEVK